jgi:hypothetical protein
MDDFKIEDAYCVAHGLIEINFNVECCPFEFISTSVSDSIGVAPIPEILELDSYKQDLLGFLLKGILKIKKAKAKMRLRNGTEHHMLTIYMITNTKGVFSFKTIPPP